MQRSLGATCHTGRITFDDIAEVLACRAGQNDGPNWLCVFRTKDDRWCYLEAGCDYTGWDCQAGGSTVVADTALDLVRYGLTDEAREALLPQLWAALGRPDLEALWRLGGGV